MYVKNIKRVNKKNLTKTILRFLRPIKKDVKIMKTIQLYVLIRSIYFDFYGILINANGESTYKYLSSSFVLIRCLLRNRARTTSEFMKHIPIFKLVFLDKNIRFFPPRRHTLHGKCTYCAFYITTLLRVR